MFLRADFREGDEDNNFSVFRVRRFTQWPGPLHWIAFPVEILTKPLIHWIASPLFTENSFFSLKSASSHPLPKNRLKFLPCSIKNAAAHMLFPRLLTPQARGHPTHPPAGAFPTRFGRQNDTSQDPSRAGASCLCWFFLKCLLWYCVSSFSGIASFSHGQPKKEFIENFLDKDETFSLTAVIVL